MYHNACSSQGFLPRQQFNNKARRPNPTRLYLSKLILFPLQVVMLTSHGFQISGSSLGMTPQPIKKIGYNQEIVQRDDSSEVKDEEPARPETP
jgi:hypothetical protein